MKMMTCKQLGGACDLQFKAETFDEMAEMSKNHGMEMHKLQDADHLAAMDEMRSLSSNPGAMQQWFEARKKEFEELPEL